MYAYSGGVGSQDLQYDCGQDTCHNALSSCTVTMSASNSTPAPSGDISVWVNVSGGDVSDDILGVMIISATTITGSLPSDAGWTILYDPGGVDDFNYYEVPSYSVSVSLEWQLTAPSTLGVYTLFARVMHGGDGIFAVDYSQGLVVTVTDYSGEDGGTPTDGVPTLIITSPSNSATVKGNLTISATVAAPTDDPIVSATLEIDDKVVSELTASPWEWVVDTTNLTEGGHRLEVIVVDSTGDTVSKEIAVFVDNESEMISMLEWMVTMGAGTVIIVCVCGIMVVIALLIRKKVVERRSR